jgi:hypothetical protein
MSLSHCIVGQAGEDEYTFAVDWTEGLRGELHACKGVSICDNIVITITKLSITRSERDVLVS